ncbi:MAG TPA: excinuclease ABC subunit UvrC [Candidatus Paceibacterota bacterium]|nr:excinuclease ABC subunit UvrC [Candidatus Paceibacterota bacterium]
MKKLYEKLPVSPGVYFMKDGLGKLLYIGKAGNLKRRVTSYFLRSHDRRIESMVSKIAKIEYRETDSALEALILEAALIKKNQPPYNVLEKDDTSFIYIEITKETYPRVLLVRGRMPIKGERFGPFLSAQQSRQALKFIRKIFPFSVHPVDKIGKLTRPCFEYEIGLCPGTCVGAVSRTDYLKNIRNIKLFLEGKKKRVLSNLKKEMAQASKKMEFEQAAKIKRRIFSLENIQDAGFINETETIREGKKLRLEGYDISNISGDSAVGSMVVFVGGRPAKSEYRKFKIRGSNRPDDTRMMKEMLTRRFGNDWTHPDVILVDGGLPQVNAAKNVLHKLGLKIPLVGIAKGPERKRNDFFGNIPLGVTEKELIALRDEAHRFAIRYHKKIRAEKFLKKTK